MFFICFYVFLFHFFLLFLLLCIWFPMWVYVLYDRIMSPLFLITSVPMLWLMGRLWIWVSGILLVFSNSSSIMVNLFDAWFFFLSIFSFPSMVVNFVMVQESWPPLGWRNFGLWFEAFVYDQSDRANCTCMQLISFDEMAFV